VPSRRWEEDGDTRDLEELLVTELIAAPTTPPQQRRLVTEIPGPRSRELAARRAAAVSSGVSTTLPVFI